MIGEILFQGYLCKSDIAIFPYYSVLLRLQSLELFKSLVYLIANFTVTVKTRKHWNKKSTFRLQVMTFYSQMNMRHSPISLHQ